MTAPLVPTGDDHDHPTPWWPRLANAVLARIPIPAALVHRWPPCPYCGTWWRRAPSDHCPGCGL